MVLTLEENRLNGALSEEAFSMSIWAGGKHLYPAVHRVPTTATATVKNPMIRP